MEMTLEAENWLSGVFPYDSKELEPKLWNTFTRITLVNIQHRERVTLDVNLAFSMSDRFARLDGVAIAEVKMDSGNQDSPFLAQMQKQRIRAQGFSKYCIGASMLYDQVKKNALKPKMLWIEKITKGVTPLMSDFGSFILSFGFNFLVALVVVRFIYYPSTHNKRYVFTFLAFNTVIYFVLSFMTSIQIGVGVGFGLFAIFSILRYRTDPDPHPGDDVSVHHRCAAGHEFSQFNRRDLAPTGGGQPGNSDHHAGTGKRVGIPL